MRTPRLSQLEARLLQPPEPARFGAAELEGLAEPVQRYLAQAITPGTPLATSARLRMRGHIKVGRWLPFRARQVLNPQLGFVWAARAGRGPQRRWPGRRRGNLAADRPAAPLWGALVGRVERPGDGQLPGRDTPVELRLRLDAAGRIASLVFDRWGDPDDTGRFGWHRFGGEVTGYRSFQGLTIPNQGRLGWSYGSDRWPAGEFFRYEITDLEPVTSPAPQPGR